MGMKERLAAKAAGIGSTPRPTQERSDAATPRIPKTAPGQLMASLPFMAEKEREVEELQQRLAEAESRLAQAGGGEQEIAELRARLEQVQQEAAQTAGQGLDVPLDQLIEIPGRRRKLTEGQFAELVENLRINPLVQAITVRRRDDGKYDVVSGNNRVAAYRELGRHSITAVLLQGSDEESDLSAFYANLLQPSLPDYEKFLGFKRREKQSGRRRVELAAEAGISASAVTEYFYFERLPAEVLSQLDARPEILGAKAALKLAQAAEAGNVDLVIEAVQMLARDSRFTQAQAVGYASKKKAVPPTRPEPRVIKDGKQIFAKIVAKENRVIVDFPAGIDPAKTVEWAKEVEEFLRGKLKASQ
ncbi:ParB/RepB/Spo0J family partition protein [Noviherbaspirillum pedocola]|uniref:ParB N-terminal domain-containing protein n=1 Tax=Noviherbaspirillum pedocola TaxID=2801341 RepID=A0A934T2U6_9BURK|nr:ParB/RepB/Spo0J family partition protein [Noviherbaspirillum pedocola]MBK4738647.1 ParB N-terminal domain-containing protein [Noviherbaspirillum pedocola]